MQLDLGKKIQVFSQYSAVDAIQLHTKQNKKQNKSRPQTKIKFQAVIELYTN